MIEALDEETEEPNRFTLPPIAFQHNESLLDTFTHDSFPSQLVQYNVPPPSHCQVKIYDAALAISQLKSFKMDILDNNPPDSATNHPFYHHT